MVWLRERLALLASSAAVIAVTALVVGAYDAVGAGVLWWTAPAAGFLLLAFFVPALICAVVVRAVARSWWPVNLEANEPRRAAGVIFAAVGILALMGATYNAAILTRRLTSAKVAAAAATALIAVVVAALFVGLAPPIIRLLGSGLERLTPRLGKLGARLLRRRAVLTWVSLAVIAFGYWFYASVLSPRLEDLAFSWMPPLSIGAVLLIVGHALIPTVRPRWLAPAIAALALASIVAATAVRYGSPRAMLDMWGDTEATSEAVAMVFDLEPLHDAYKTDPPVEVPGAAHPDVVLITVDTWRADRTPPFGIGAAMPRFARFARTAAVFRSAVAPSNNTRRSVPAMMIGAQPSRIRGRIKGWALALDPRHVLLAERFRAGGYQTAGFFCCRNLFAPAKGTGFSRGITNPRFSKRDAELADMAAEYLKKTLVGKPGIDRAPVFAWVHMIGPHAWYTGSKKLAPAVARRRYDRRLGRTDDPLGVLLDTLGEVRDHTVIVLTSDHGEGLADHDAVRHANGLYDSQIRVPLVVSIPDIEPRVIERPVSLIALAPTLLELAGFESPSDGSMDPGSFSSVVTGDSDDAAAPVYAEQIKDRSVRQRLWAVIAEGHKLITGGPKGDELYELAKDPRELTNLAAEKPAVVKRLRAEIERRKKRRSEPAW